MNSKKAKELRKLVYGNEYSHKDRLFISMSPLVDISRRSIYKIGKKMFKTYGSFNQFKALLPQLTKERNEIESQHKSKLAALLDKASKNLEKLSHAQN